jgi:hypothetical protein
MSGRPIRKDRFELLDELGIGYVCKFYVEGNMSVQSLCEFLFDPTKHGRVGVSVLYLWISERGYRGAWDRAVALKRQCQQKAIKETRIDLPEIDWDMWHMDTVMSSIISSGTGDSEGDTEVAE